ncbi:MAG: cupin domain-containing protein, partial [Gammaproteobacteria bacterium]|nr:cupin domain-containing protein [Gammaproteobacteria bacterium]
NIDQHSFSTPLLPSAVKGKKFLKNDLALTGMEVSFNKFPPGAAMPFYHQHREHEELYLFLKGKGQFQIDGQIIEVKEGTAIRVAPAGVRAWRNNSGQDLYYVVIQAKANSLPKGTIEDGVVVDQKVTWKD